VVWIPDSLEELEALLQEGYFDETHYREAKTEIPPGTKGSKELAKDLASFAVDGGALFVGVAEPESGRFVFRPTSAG
jgi:hypothetical protein